MKNIKTTTISFNDNLKKDVDNFKISINSDYIKLNHKLEELKNEWDKNLLNHINESLENNKKIEDEINNQNKFIKSNENNLNNNSIKLNDIENKIKLIENKNVLIENNKKNINIENKKIDNYEKNEDKTKIFRIVQSNNKIIFKDITKICETEEKEKEFIKKIKISLKKDEDENEKITYEISKKEDKWEFKRYIKNIINKINRGRITYRINFNKLKHIYIMKYNDNQIQFIKTSAISKYVYNYIYYVKLKNSFVFVNNKRRKFKNKKINFNVKKFNTNRKFNYK